VSLFLIAAGAILTFAVSDRSRAVDLDVVGVILMLVGLFGLLLSLLLWEQWGGGYFRRRTYVDAAGAPAYGYRRRGYGRRTRVVEEQGGPPGGPAGPGPYDEPPP
jgi:hypothetical protein